MTEFLLVLGSIILSLVYFIFMLAYLVFIGLVVSVLVVCLILLIIGIVQGIRSSVSITYNEQSDARLGTT